MNFSTNILHIDHYSRIGFILLVLTALVFAPLASAGISELASASKNEHSQSCGEMHEAGAAASEQASTSDCCDQNTDCKTHCQNLVLTHVPVSALLTAFTLQFHSADFIYLSSPQMLTGIAASLDPRPPRV